MCVGITLGTYFMNFLFENRLKRIAFLATAVVLVSVIAIGIQVNSVVTANQANLSDIWNISSLTFVMMTSVTLLINYCADEKLHRVDRLAHIDELTGLINRRKFNRILRESLRKCSNEGTSIGVMFLDMDHFKAINDTHGHEAGDFVINQFAKRIQNCIDRQDTLCRVSGDEFALIISNIDDFSDVQSVSKRISDAMAQPFVYNERHIYAGISMGAVVIENGKHDSATALRMADFALIKSKENGRGQLSLFNPEMAEKLEYRSRLEVKLRGAIETKSLSIKYQPMFNQNDGSITGVEALIRWCDSELGEVPPGDFLPLAQELGLMAKIGDFVLEHACKEINSIEALRLSVNISPSQFKQEDFVSNLKSTLKKTGFPANRLELEITQDLLSDTGSDLKDKLEQLRMMGLKIALNDFGTGYSSMLFLREFKLDRIKLDSSFMLRMQIENDGEKMIENMISLGTTLGNNVTVEGVETEDMLKKLNALGANEYQGFLFSKPLTVTELIATKMVQEFEAKARLNEKRSDIVPISLYRVN